VNATIEKIKAELTDEKDANKEILKHKESLRKMLDELKVQLAQEKETVKKLKN